MLGIMTTVFLVTLVVEAISSVLFFVGFIASTEMILGTLLIQSLALIYILFALYSRKN